MKYEIFFWGLLIQTGKLALQNISNVSFNVKIKAF